MPTYFTNTNRTGVWRSNAGALEFFNTFDRAWQTSTFKSFDRLRALTELYQISTFDAESLAAELTAATEAIERTGRESIGA